MDILQNLLHISCDTGWSQLAEELVALEQRAKTAEATQQKLAEQVASQNTKL